MLVPLDNMSRPVSWVGCATCLWQGHDWYDHLHVLCPLPVSEICQTRSATCIESFACVRDISGAISYMHCVPCLCQKHARSDQLHGLCPLPVSEAYQYDQLHALSSLPVSETCQTLLATCIVSLACVRDISGTISYMHFVPCLCQRHIRYDRLHALCPLPVSETYLTRSAACIVSVACVRDMSDTISCMH